MTKTAISANPAPPVSRRSLWIGWILSALPAFPLLSSALMKFVKPQPVVEGFALLGLPIGLAWGLGILELGCTMVYLIPRFSVLGAILLAGYLGGATLTHLRVGDPFIMPVVLGVFVWGGIYLREPRLRALIPLRGRH